MRYLEGGLRSRIRAKLHRAQPARKELTPAPSPPPQSARLTFTGRAQRQCCACAPPRREELGNSGGREGGIGRGGGGGGGGCFPAGLRRPPVRPLWSVLLIVATRGGGHTGDSGSAAAFPRPVEASPLRPPGKPRKPPARANISPGPASTRHGRLSGYHALSVTWQRRLCCQGDAPRKMLPLPRGRGGGRLSGTGRPPRGPARRGEAEAPRRAWLAAAAARLLRCGPLARQQRGALPAWRVPGDGA